MPISLTIAQETGVNATYHQFNGNLSLSPTGLTVMVSSYLDQPSFAAGKTPLCITAYDATPILSAVVTAVAPTTNQQAIAALIEPYLISVTGGPFAGGTIVS